MLTVYLLQLCLFLCPSLLSTAIGDSNKKNSLSFNYFYIFVLEDVDRICNNAAYFRCLSQILNKIQLV